MDQPIYNPNSVDEEDQNIIDNNPSENIYQKPISNQDNDLMPPDMNAPPQQEYNPPQNIIPPSQNPIPIPQQNQVIPTPIQENYYPPSNQVYYSPPPMIQNPQSQPQPYYPPQQGIPQVQQIQYYPPQNNAIYIQQQDFSQINSKGIFQIDENTFKISPGGCNSSGSILMIILGLLLIILGMLAPSTSIFFGLLFLSIGLITFLRSNKKIIFKIGQNNLTIIKKYVCNKRSSVYNKGDILRVDFINNYTDRAGKIENNYQINIVLSNGESLNIYSIKSYAQKFTEEEIQYFLYIINNHIGQNMV